MISICLSDCLIVTWLLIFNQPGINEGRYLDMVNSSTFNCRVVNIISLYLFSVPGYNFLGLMLERLYAIKKPFRFREALLEQQVWRYVAACWSLAWLPTIPLWFDSTIEDHWRNNTNCTCFFPLDNKLFLLWGNFVNFIIPACLIFLIWIVIAHHFATQPTNSVLKWATLKMIFITGLFLASITPHCLAYLAAAFETPKSTKPMDITYPLSLVNSAIQPIIYIVAFDRLRRALIKRLFCHTAEEYEASYRNKLSVLSVRSENLITKKASIRVFPNQIVVLQKSSKL